MDLLKKIETLLSAKTHSVLPRRGRRSILDEQEAEILAEIRKALGDVETKERELAQRIKIERAEAENAAERGDRLEEQAHERRATELEYRLEEESILAINLEEKLAALEEKLNLAKEAVEKEARNVAIRDAEASKILDRDSDTARTEETPDTPTQEVTIPDSLADDDSTMSARKSRLAG